jgi:hypothetical protein
LGSGVLAPCILNILLWNKALFCVPRAFYIRENDSCIYIRPFEGIVEKERDLYLCGEPNSDLSVVS